MGKLEGGDNPQPTQESSDLLDVVEDLIEVAAPLSPLADVVVDTISDFKPSSDLSSGIMAAFGLSEETEPEEPAQPVQPSENDLETSTVTVSVEVPPLRRERTSDPASVNLGVVG